MQESPHARSDDLRCPVCRARQKRQPQCRRCRADLRLLVRAGDRAGHLQQRYRQAIQGGRPEQAAEVLNELTLLQPAVARQLRHAVKHDST